MVVFLRVSRAGLNEPVEVGDLDVVGELYQVYPAALLLRQPSWPGFVAPSSGGGFVAGLDEEEREPSWQERIQFAFEARLGDAPRGKLRPSIYSVGGRAIALLGPAEAHECVQSILRVEAERKGRRAPVDLEILALPRAAYVALRRRSPRGLLPADRKQPLADREDLRRSRYSVAGASGGVHTVCDTKVEKFVLGVEQVSGGTGYAIIEVGDPITFDVGSGTELRVQATLDVEGATARLRVEGTQAEIVSRRTVQVRYPTVLASKKDGGDAVPRADVQLYLPSQEAVGWRATRRLPVDRWAILQTEPGPESGPPGRIRVLVGRVRTD